MTEDLDSEVRFDDTGGSESESPSFWHETEERLEDISGRLATLLGQFCQVNGEVLEDEHWGEMRRRLDCLLKEAEETGCAFFSSLAGRKEAGTGLNRLNYIEAFVSVYYGLLRNILSAGELFKEQDSILEHAKKRSLELKKKYGCNA